MSTSSNSHEGSQVVIHHSNPINLKVVTANEIRVHYFSNAPVTFSLSLFLSLNISFLVGQQKQVMFSERSLIVVFHSFKTDVPSRSFTLNFLTTKLLQKTSTLNDFSKYSHDNKIYIFTAIYFSDRFVCHLNEECFSLTCSSSSRTGRHEKSSPRLFRKWHQS